MCFNAATEKNESRTNHGRSSLKTLLEALADFSRLRVKGLLVGYYFDKQLLTRVIVITSKHNQPKGAILLASVPVPLGPARPIIRIRPGAFGTECNGWSIYTPPIYEIISRLRLPPSKDKTEKSTVDGSAERRTTERRQLTRMWGINTSRIGRRILLLPYVGFVDVRETCQQRQPLMTRTLFVVTESYVRSNIAE